jgi:hypothetical protein
MEAKAALCPETIIVVVVVVEEVVVEEVVVVVVIVGLNMSMASFTPLVRFRHMGRPHPPTDPRDRPRSHDT